jgi:hypothetical protein
MLQANAHLDDGFSLRHELIATPLLLLLTMARPASRALVGNNLQAHCSLQTAHRTAITAFFRLMIMEACKNGAWRSEFRLNVDR